MSKIIEFTKRSAHSAGLALLLTMFATQAHAHHAMGGTMPATFGEGLLSGLGHPIIGIDHLAFVVGIGLAASFLARGLAMPAFFVGATLIGTGIHLLAVDLPIVEVVISASVLLIGVLIVSRREQPMAVWALLFVVAGVFHGYAYGESIVGAEPTPLLAYLSGFAVIQYAIAAVACLLARRLQGVAVAARSVETRLAGSFVAGVGFVFLFGALSPF